MPSLTTHLTEAETHGRLPFHPACPICQQTRVAGDLPSAGVLPPRAAAVFAAGVMAASTAAPAMTAVAAEPDREQSGTATVSPGAAPDSAGDPDFDPGGEATALPSQPSVPPSENAQTQPTSDQEPGAQSAPSDAAEPIVDAGDGSDRSDGATTANPAAPAPAPTAGAPPPATPDPATPQPAPAATPAPVARAAPAAQPTATGSGQQSDAGARAERKGPATPRTPHSTTRQDTAVSHAAPVPVRTPQPPPPSQPAAIAEPSGPPAKPGDRAHTVRAGESLWAIASDLLGRNASPAQIARGVDRLWRLNNERIGTGDPDLLMIGTRLRLR